MKAGDLVIMTKGSSWWDKDDKAKLIHASVDEIEKQRWDAKFDENSKYPNSVLSIGCINEKHEHGFGHWEPVEEKQPEEPKTKPLKLPDTKRRWTL